MANRISKTRTSRFPNQEGRVTSTGEPAQDTEFSRMERLMRGLLKVPKKAINGQDEKAKKKAG